MKVEGELVWGRCHHDWDCSAMDAKRERGGWYEASAFTHGSFHPSCGRPHAWALQMRMPARGSANFCIGVALSGHSVSTPLHSSPNAWVTCDSDGVVRDEDVLVFVLRYDAGPDNGVLEIRKRGKVAARFSRVGSPACVAVGCLGAQGYGAAFVPCPREGLPTGSIVY
eukprot:TRINITY_DN10971_c0_g1_i1.p2 TRINITY_DN10971_c0_g1~~TRINITY_DN10971_c0_g1_i1.p2  ORF type:complete len:168 (+),score=36.12 TRINITY_DN10971_c0_g1_i1:359-862(+)